MIYTVNEEFRIIILLIAFGTYIFFMSDFINVFSNKIKRKLLRYIVSIILWFIQIYISYIFVYKMQDGYMPLYFILFIVVGLIFYLFIRNQTLFILKRIINMFYYLLDKLVNLIKETILPKYLSIVIKYNKKRIKDKKIKDIITEAKNDN